VREVVDDEDLALDVGVLGRDRPTDLDAHTVGLREHVELRRQRQMLALATSGELERVTDHALASGPGDRLDREAARPELADRSSHRAAARRGLSQLGERSLGSDVEVLEILAHDHEVDTRRACHRRAGALDEPDRSHVRVGRASPPEIEERSGGRAARRHHTARKRGQRGFGGDRDRR
jgi:hypothetical protein